MYACIYVCLVVCIHVRTYACTLQSFLVASQHTTTRSSRSMKKVGRWVSIHLRRHPDVRTRSSQQCFYDYLRPNHTPLQTVPCIPIQDTPRHTQTNTPDYTSKHLAITDSQADSHTYKNIRACFNTRCYSPLQIQLQLKMYSIQCRSSRKQLHFHNVANLSVHVYVYVYMSVSQSVCQSVAMSVSE